MKILVIGLDCAAPELLLGDERLTNFRRLMEAGCYGRLQSVIPPITVPAWMCMATSQDPGSLGVYGFRNRSDYSYGGLQIASSKSIREMAIWDELAREGKRSVVIGVPPGYPPRKVNGIFVSCFLTPDTTKDTYTHPAETKREIERLVGEYPVDVKGFRTDKKDWLKDEIYAMSRKHFDVVRHFLHHAEWDYFQFVEIGLDRMHHGFWKFHDPQHVLHEPGNPYQEVIRDYYQYLDDELGQILEVLSDDTVVLVLSDHGAQRLDGGFCVNEWLVKEGLLVLEEYPKEVTAFGKLSVNWEKTKVWSEGGYYARVFFNVKGREPQGVIEPADYEKFRDEIKAKFEATVDDKGRPLGTLVFKPQEVYKSVRNVAPDLIVHFGGLYWRSIGGVGYPTIHVQENDTGPDDCNHAQFGAFILAAGNSPLRGEIEGAHLLDLAPTLLELGGYAVPPSMQPAGGRPRRGLGELERRRDRRRLRRPLPSGR
ncbi:MAG: alkaline phosphatase family protein, partial [Planctomycetes bacterium]|nr:alkaline phosphatase family protein [Planctomycetota bacterium]